MRSKLKAFSKQYPGISVSLSPAKWNEDICELPVVHVHHDPATLIQMGPGSLETLCFN